MKIVFFGTPEYVLPVLEKIHKRFSRRGVSPISAVVTQPPRPVGRKQLLSYSSVDTWAFKKKIDIYHDPRQVLKEKPEADLGVLASYGSIIPKEVIEYFPHGILNVHPSFLPNWRGASPIQASLVSGETETGVSIISLDEKLDHGPIASQFKETIKKEDNADTLKVKLFDRGADVLVELLEPYLKGKIIPHEQNHKVATFTNQIKKQDAFVPGKYLEAATKGLLLKEDWEVGFIKDFVVEPSAEVINCFIRAMYSWPSAWTYVKVNKKAREKRLRILTAHLVEGKLVLDTVQLEGKGEVSWKQFKEAYKEAAFAE